MMEEIAKFVKSFESIASSMERIAVALERNPAGVLVAASAEAPRTRKAKAAPAETPTPTPVDAPQNQTAPTPTPVDAPQNQTAPAPVAANPTPAPVVPSAPVPAPSVPSEAPTGLTVKDVRAKLTAVASDKTDIVAFGILQKFGCQSISTLDPAKYGEFMVACDAAMKG